VEIRGRVIERGVGRFGHMRIGNRDLNNTLMMDVEIS